MKLYKTIRGPVIEDAGVCYLAPATDWDALFNRDDLGNALVEMTRHAPVLDDLDLATETLAPIGRQEVWAAGVTYLRSRSARIEESKAAGGGDRKSVV